MAADRIGHTAIRLAALMPQLGDHIRSPLDGSGALAEVYPAAALNVWGLPHRGYKRGVNAAGRNELVDLLQSAVVRKRKVRLTYRDRGERLIDPWGLVDKDDIWYLIAGTERGRRTFRVDRIVAAEPTDEPAERPRAARRGRAKVPSWDEIVFGAKPE